MKAKFSADTPIAHNIYLIIPFLIVVTRYYTTDFLQRIEAEVLLSFDVANYVQTNLSQYGGANKYPCSVFYFIRAVLFDSMFEKYTENHFESND